MAATRRRYGSLRKLPSGRWQARVRTAEGELIPAPQTFATKTDAARYLASTETDQTRGQWVDHRLGTTTVGEWAERYLATTPHLKVSSAADNDSLLRTFIEPRFGKTPVGSIRQIDIAEWVSDLVRSGKSASRVRKAHGLLSRILRAAAASGYIAADPSQGVKLPRLPKSEPTIVEPAVVASLVAAMEQPYGLLVDLLAYTGVRIGEAFALRRRDVNLLHSQLHIVRSLSYVGGQSIFADTKNHQSRTISIPAGLARDLKKHLAKQVPNDPEALVFSAPRGGPLNYTNFIRRHWDPAIIAAGFPRFTPHNLRDSHASWLVDDGWSVLDVAQRLGHESATVTTKHYARAIAGRDLDVARGLDAIRSRVTSR